MVWVADRTLWLDSTQENVVEDGDPDAAFLLCRPGRRVDAAIVSRYKLRNKPVKKQKAAAKKGTK